MEKWINLTIWKNMINKQFKEEKVCKSYKALVVRYEKNIVVHVIT